MDFRFRVLGFEKKVRVLESGVQVRRRVPTTRLKFRVNGTIALEKKRTPINSRGKQLRSKYVLGKSKRNILYAWIIFLCIISCFIPLLVKGKGL